MLPCQLILWITLVYSLSPDSEAAAGKLCQLFSLHYQQSCNVKDTVSGGRNTHHRGDLVCVAHDALFTDITIVYVPLSAAAVYKLEFMS